MKPCRRARGGSGLVEAAAAVLGAQVAILVGGFAYAAAADWRAREVTDRLWQVMGLAGLVLGALSLAPGGLAPVILWIVVAAFTLQHMFAWTLGPRLEAYENAVDIGLYVIVVATVVLASIELGVGPRGVPYVVIALLATVLFSRGLFEAGLLFGGADAKALMIAGVLLPVFATPLLVPPAAIAPINEYLPFPINLLMDAALLSAAVPIALAVRNAARGEFRGGKTFTGYSIPVRELPERFVWVHDPMSREGREEEATIETSEQDRQRRIRIARELTAQGVERVWVTPQIPYLVLLAAGTVAALLAGNLVFDLIALV